jgi:hypothetical protein
MASTITAGNATNGLALSCDNTGILELKTGTGSGTTAVTIDASQNVTLATGIAGDFKMNSGYGSVATAYGCRAWVNFNGTGTPAIRASGNVSSITDLGAGYYTVNFTTALPDANFSACCSGRNSASTTLPLVSSAISFATTSVNLRFLTLANADQDSDFVSVAIFR